MDDRPGARTLVMLRHAKSSWDYDVADHDRPLSGRGERDAKAAGQLLGRRHLLPDLVICSSAARTRQTWAGAISGGASSRDVRYTRAVYGAWVPELVGLLRQAPDDVRTLLLLGHAPGIPDLVSYLCTRTRSSAWAQLDAKYPTSGLAVASVPGAWRDLGRACAELVSFDIPRG